MREACELRGHDNEQCRLDAIAALVTPVPLETLLIHNRQCDICHEVLGIAFTNREAELPVKLPCGHVYGSGCLNLWLLENSCCGHFRVDYSQRLPEDF
jgi:hypothetical protein